MIHNSAARVCRVAALGTGCARLRQALSAYDEALRFRTPTGAPLGHAMTQGNLLNLYQTLAGEPGEDRMSRLLDALRSGWTAFRFFTALQHSDFQQRVMHLLRGLRAACGDDFDTLWAALEAGPPLEWLIAADSPVLPPPLADLLACLAAAGVTDEDSLRTALTADPELRAAVERAIRKPDVWYHDDHHAVLMGSNLVCHDVRFDPIQPRMRPI